MFTLALSTGFVFATVPCWLVACGRPLFIIFEVLFHTFDIKNKSRNQ